MNELLIAMYDSFYKPIAAEKQNKEIDECHKTLIESLEKPDRRLVLRIIDAKDRIIEDSTIDAFCFGFRMGCQLAVELKMSETTHLREKRKSPSSAPFSYPTDKSKT